tara:strand:+ start:711 stop:1688 length:978 start_codon:yes stop_codon:yes gene_type:complete
MAFLDNSGDIILDAVLTDAGRKRLARGDGTFKVSKYAFGDDEIDYSSYNPDAASGSAYYDLEILQTPILEAFTNNRSSLKHKLISITNNSLLYLPELVLNEVADNTTRIADSAVNGLTSGSFLVVVNSTTFIELNKDAPATFGNEVIYGYGTPSPSHGDHIRVDQGLNTNKLDPMNKLSSELTERQYMIQIDSRLGMITDVFGGALGSPSFIDDDQIATYYVTLGVGSYVAECLAGQIDSNADPDNYVGKGSGDELLQGPRGTKVRFGFRASSNLQASDYLFDTIGRSATVASDTYGCIDTTVKVTGVTTGYSIDIPVTFAKKTS